MSFGKFCPQCGQATEALVSGQCQECFLKKHDLFTFRDLIIPICVKCGKLQIKGIWRGFSETQIGDELSLKVKLNHDIDEPKISVELANTGPLEYDAIIKVQGFINNVLVVQEKSKHFKLQKVSCDACMKLVSNYREAVIQIRAYHEEDTKEMLDLAKSLIEKEKEKDSLSGIVKEGKVKTGGYDLWIGSRKAAMKVVRYMGKLYQTPVITSKTLIGESEAGKPEYRFTFCVKK